MAARQQSVQDRVGNGCIAEPRMSVLDGRLGRHDRRARSRPVVDHLRQVSPRRSIHGGQPPVVQQQDVGARDSGKPTPKPALPCSTRRSSARRGTRRYSAECPRRQAYAASAQAIQDLPEPVGPVTRIAVPSSTHRDSARLICGGAPRGRPSMPSALRSSGACWWRSKAAPRRPRPCRQASSAQLRQGVVHHHGEVLQCVFNACSVEVRSAAQVVVLGRDPLGRRRRRSMRSRPLVRMSCTCRYWPAPSSRASAQAASTRFGP